MKRMKSALDGIVAYLPITCFTGSILSVMAFVILMLLTVPATSSATDYYSCTAIRCWGSINYDKECRRKTKEANEECSNPRALYCGLKKGFAEEACGCAATCSDAVCTKFPVDNFNNECYEAHYR